MEDGESGKWKDKSAVQAERHSSSAVVKKISRFFIVLKQPAEQLAAAGL